MEWNWRFILNSMVNYYTLLPGTKPADFREPDGWVTAQPLMPLGRTPAQPGRAGYLTGDWPRLKSIPTGEVSPRGLAL